MRCCRFFKRAASFEQPVDLIVQRFRAGAAGKRSPEQRVLYQLVEQQIDDPDVLGIYTSGKQQITGDSLVTDPEPTFQFPELQQTVWRRLLREKQNQTVMHTDRFLLDFFHRESSNGKGTALCQKLFGPPITQLQLLGADIFFFQVISKQVPQHLKIGIDVVEIVPDLCI